MNFELYCKQIKKLQLQYLTYCPTLVFQEPSVTDTAFEKKLTIHAECMKKYKDAAHNCLPDIEPFCQQKHIHVAKWLRLTMDTVDEVLISKYFG